MPASRADGREGSKRLLRDDGKNDDMASYVAPHYSGQGSS